MAKKEIPISIGFPRLGSILSNLIDSKKWLGILSLRLFNAREDTYLGVEDMSDSELDSAKKRREDIIQHCEKLIRHFKRKADEAKRNYRIFKYSSVILATTVAILTTLQTVKQWPQLQLVTPIISSIAALATTLLAVTNTQEHWIQARSTQQKLQAEEIMFTQGAGIYSNLHASDRVRKFAEQVNQIWDSGHKQWEKVIKPTN